MILSIGIVIIIIFCLLFCDRYLNSPRPALSFDVVKAKGVEGLREYYKIPGISYCVIKEGEIVEMNTSGYTYQGYDKKLI